MKNKHKKLEIAKIVLHALVFSDALPDDTKMKSVRKTAMRITNNISVLLNI